jgi:hypothetical protein
MAAIDALPVCDFDVYLNKKEGWEAECAKVADCLYRTGILIVKDPVRPRVVIVCFAVSFHRQRQGTYRYAHPKFSLQS